MLISLDEIVRTGGAVQSRVERLGPARVNLLTLGRAEPRTVTDESRAVELMAHPHGLVCRDGHPPRAPTAAAITGSHPGELSEAFRPS